MDKLAWPNSSWIFLMSTPSSRRWVANECRSVWVWTFFRSTLLAACATIFWMFRVESFPCLPENRYSWLRVSCCSFWRLISSKRKSGILKIRSLLPLAWRMCPIFSGRFRSCVLRFVISETLNPAA